MEHDAVCKLLDDVLSIVAPYLDAATVAQLMCTSRRSVQELQQVLSVPRLLTNTAEQAANKDVLLRIPGPTLSAWLERFPVPDINKYSDALLHIPSFPPPLAAALVGAGLCTSYQQLLSVVHAAVPGVQVWVEAHEQLNLPPPVDMHPLAVGLCCGKDMPLVLQEPQDIAQADLRDLLHIAIAMPRNGNATSGLSLLCVWPQAQKLDADACLQLLQAAVKVGASERVQVLLDKLPAAQKLSQNSIIALLHAAVEARLLYTVSLLCKLPAAQAVTTATVFSLLQTAVLSKGARTVKAICQLPAARLVAASQIAELLHAAVQTKDDQKLEILSQLPAASAISPAAVASLMVRALGAAAKAGPCHQKIAALCALAGAQGIDSSALQDLLQTVIRREATEALEAVCQLPAAQGSTASQVAELLHAVIQTEDNQKLAILLRLPAASAIPAATVAALLARALAAAAKAGRCHQKVAALCNLANAQGIDSSTLHKLLLTAAQLEPAEQQATVELCSLPSTQLLEATSVRQLLRTAVAAGGCEKVIALLQAPTSRDIGQQDMLELLYTAATSSECGTAAALLGAFCEQCRTAGSDVANILQAAGHAGQWHNVAALCFACMEIPVDARAVAELLAAAIAAAACWDSKDAICALLRLPAMQQLPLQQYTQLLLTAAANKALNRFGNFEHWLKLPAAEQIEAATVRSALNQLARNAGQPAAVASLLKLPAASSLQISDLVDNIRTAALSMQWLPALAIMQASAAAAAAVDQELFQAILAHSAAAVATEAAIFSPYFWHLWGTTSRHLHLDMLKGSPALRGLQQVLDAATLENVVSGAAGNLAGTIALARAAAREYLRNSKSSNDSHARSHMSHVSMYSDLIMSIVAAAAIMQLPKAEHLPEALVAKLLMAVGHVWDHTQLVVSRAEAEQGSLASNDRHRAKDHHRIPLHEAYARTTVAFLDFLSQQGFNPREIVRSSEGDAGAVQQVAAALVKAKVLAKGLRRIGSVGTSQGVQPPSMMSAGVFVSPGPAADTPGHSVMHPWGLPATRQPQKDVLSDVLEAAVEQLLLDL